MRRYMLAMTLVLVVSMVGVPVLIGRLAAPGLAEALPPQEQMQDQGDQITLKVYMPGPKVVQEMPLAEYLVGVVAAEMPPDFAMEALKAQFVVARTYAVRRMHRFAGPERGGCPLNPAADVCADPQTGQAYLSRADAEARWGKATTDVYWRRLEQAEAATAGLLVFYHGDLIDPLYHSVSGKMTEDAADYFGQSLPYLKPVDDHWGQEAPERVLVETKSFTLDAVATALATTGKAVSVAALTSAAQGGKAPVRVVAPTATGRVKTVSVAGVTVTGREFREKLGLRSTDFTVTVQDGKIVVTTYGYGHGVGMSQYGADGMAKEGKDFRQILTHYYTGVEIRRMFEE